MEAASLTTSPSPSAVVSRRTPLLRFQTDERLVALMREGHERAFELLFKRYQARLLAFCRRLLGSPQDAEDVLQDVFAAAHAAILADSRPINARPWLYRIARNQCVNHLRKPTADGVDSMDVHPYEHGVSTFEQVERREELRAIVADVHQLPTKQRTALVLREIDDFSYADIAQTMGTTLPSVKSLLVRARMSLAQSSHRGALAPLGLLALLRRLLPAKLKLGGSSGAGGTAGTAGSAAGAAGGVAGTAGGVAATGGSGLTFGGVVSAASTGIGGALGAKAAVGVASAAIVAAGAVGVAKMDPGGHGQTVGASRSAMATSQAASPTGSSATSATAAAQRAAGTAPGLAVRARSRHGVKAGRSSHAHLPHLGRSVTRATGDATRAAAAGASAATAAVAATAHAAANAASAAAGSVNPPKSVVPPAPRLGQATGLSGVQSHGLSHRHPLPPKLEPAETLIP
jgi:RNA polymerase sigma factor (sigma-70 family)